MPARCEPEQVATVDIEATAPVQERAAQILLVAGATLALPDIVLVLAGARRRRYAQ